MGTSPRASRFVPLVVHRGLVQYLHVHEDKQMRGLRPDSEYVELAVEVSAMLADASPRHDHCQAYHRHTP